MAGWWERYRLYRDKKIRKPGALGVWIVFFSLAALPLFGLGQTCIPPEATARREYAFSLLIVYVGSGLGLLLITNFLSLRHYLRQRKLTMPVTVTAGWLFLGVLLIVLHLYVSTLLPRPTDPQPLWDWTGLTMAVEKKPAPFSPLREKGTKEEGEKGRKGEGEKGKEGEGEKGKEGEGEKGSEGEGERREEGRREGPRGQERLGQTGNGGGEAEGKFSARFSAGARTGPPRGSAEGDRHRRHRRDRRHHPGPSGPAFPGQLHRLGQGGCYNSSRISSSAWVSHRARRNRRRRRR